jgi:DNA-binding HxlR family transcriptional regulator
MGAALRRGDGRERSGAHILAMASNRINRGILLELTKRPLEWTDNRQARITPAGREMLFVSSVIERWLQNAPGGALKIEDEEAEATIAALIDGWITTIVHLLAVEPLTLTELGRALDTMSREDVEAKVTAMSDVGLLEARPSKGEGATYAVTDWLREAIAPLGAAARCERRYSAEETPPVAPLDVEAAFLLTLPLLRLPADLSGHCRLVVELPDSEERPAAGAMAYIEDERIASCSTNLEGSADAWVIGSDHAWLEAVVEGMTEDLEFGGDGSLVRALLAGLHERLFGS